MTKILILFTALLIAVPQNFGNSDDQTNQIARLTIPRGVENHEVATAIRKAASHLKWNLIKETDTIAVIQLVHRGYDSTLTLDYSDDTIRIFSDSWKTSSSGERKSKKEPWGWIERVKKYVVHFMEEEVFHK